MAAASTSFQPHPHSPSTPPPTYQLRAPLDPLARERLLRPYLAQHPSTPQSALRTFLSTRFYHLLLTLLHLLFSIYLRLRWAYHTLLHRAYSMLYYHHRTPQLIQKDVKQLTRLPNHLSVILDYDSTDRVGGLDNLIDDVAEIACWCASAGIPMLSVYERTGILKSYITTSHRAISQRLHAYFGKDRPTLRVRAPHSTSFSGGDGLHFHDPPSPRPISTGGSGAANGDISDADLEILFISEEDGRESLVDLTRTLCEMAQKGKISVDDVSQDLIDAEVSGTLMSEPDLLIIFGNAVNLKGYPPWQVRLTELFHLQDNEGVGYHVFLRAMYKYAKAEMRFGR